MNNGSAYFWPYESTEDFFGERTLPEFGVLPSVWQIPLDTWQFYFAANRDMVPMDFADANPDTKGWNHIELPSVWQQQGFGFPTKLIVEDLYKEQGKGLSRRIRSRLSEMSASEEADEVGVYRTWISFSAAYLDRAVYFQCAGILGRFAFYVNGERIADSQAIFTPTKILLSPYLREGQNLITIMVFRLEDHRITGSKAEQGTFGFSGIFRLPEIVAESLIEISDLLVDSTASYASPYRKAIASSGDSLSEDSSIDPTKDIDAKDSTTPENTADKTDAPPATEIVSEPDISIERIPDDIDTYPEYYDGRLLCRVLLKNHLNVSLRVRVEPSLYKVLPEYDPYHPPLVPITVADCEVSLRPHEEKECLIEINASDITPWSHDRPVQYDFFLTLKKDHHTICVKRKRIGFRTISSDKGQFFINYKRVLLRGVRYYPFDPVDGIALSPTRYRRDVILMKRAGLNMIYHCGYAPDPVLLQLCDQYGMYIVPQARLYRFSEMRETLYSHPSVAAWSVSQADFDIQQVKALKAQIRKECDFRPFYCEKDKSKELSDIFLSPQKAGALYGVWNDIALDVARMKEIGIRWRLPERGHRTQIVKTLLEREYRFIHQADLEEINEARDTLITQGLVDPHRKPYPVYADVKKQCETLRIVFSRDIPESVSVLNTNPFGSYSHLLIQWQLLLDGRPLLRGEEPIDHLPAGETNFLTLPFRYTYFLQDGWMHPNAAWQAISREAVKRELMLDIRLVAERGFSVFPANFVMAVSQYTLPGEAGKEGEENALSVVTGQNALALSTMRESPVQVVSEPDTLRLLKGQMLLSFSRRSGALEEIRLPERNFFAGSLWPSFFRAAANMDRADSAYVMSSTIFSKESNWREVQQNIKLKKTCYRMQGEDFLLTAVYTASAFVGEIPVSYKMYADGRLEVRLTCVPKSPLPRMGFRVPIPRDLYRVLWYGRGPGESYSDRKESAPFGYYEGLPEDMYQPYVRPQENAAHTDTQYLILLGGDGKGIRIRSLDSEGFSFTVAVYSPEALDDSLHQEDLEASEHYELFLDFYQRGVERTGKETEQFKKRQQRTGAFILEPVLLP